MLPAEDAMRLRLLLLPLLLAGCAPREIILARGLDDYGRRYLWTKPQGTEIDRRRDMIECAEPTQAQLEEGFRAASIPFFGLALIGPLLDSEHAALTQRAACMEGRGWQLVDVTTNQPQQISFSLGSARLTPMQPAASR
jgi:integrase